MYTQPRDKAVTFYTSVQPQDFIYSTNREGVYALHVNHLALPEDADALPELSAIAASYHVHLFHYRTHEPSNGAMQVSCLFVGHLPFVLLAAMNLWPNHALVGDRSHYDLSEPFWPTTFTENYVNLRTREGFIPVIDLDGDRDAAMESMLPMRYVLDYIFKFEPGIRGESYADAEPGRVNAGKQLYCSYLPVNPDTNDPNGYYKVVSDILMNTGCKVEYTLPTHALVSSDDVRDIIEALLRSIPNGENVKGKELAAQQVLRLLEDEGRPSVHPIYTSPAE